MVILTMIVAMAMLWSRIQAARAGQIDRRYFKTAEGPAPEQVVKTARHFTNLFELPVLYYTACSLALVIGISGTAIHIWAWLFVAARAAHAIIHIGPNKVYPRMISYQLGWVAVFAIWILLVMHAGKQLPI